MNKLGIFQQVLIEIAHDIPQAILERFCSRLTYLHGSTSQEDFLTILSEIPDAGVRQKLKDLIKSWWSNHGTFEPKELAAMLRGASLIDEYWRKLQTLELAWTGPLGAEGGFRRTDQALLDLIASAKRELLIVTFAAYRIPSVAVALKSAARRGINIRIVIESTEQSEGKVTFDAFAALGDDVVQHSTIYVWPKENRERDERNRYGSLHAKCAVADESVLFISSANLTEFAMNLNLELGILIKGGSAPLAVRRQFSRLVNEKIITPITI
jgi:phosphatidylserine/phosphatidylglycerophosphate/cardiolipin synthase-like enzyme